MAQVPRLLAGLAWNEGVLPGGAALLRHGPVAQQPEEEATLVLTRHSTNHSVAFSRLPG